ncbi:hypothetical protein C2U70_00170 [Bradyrhizobium guangdongense]|uniref:DUF4956 domain-containing protein n=1 Tax=Bradyrhizobium guangdongense TaxID=1325090 RepID=UPI00112C35D1|nr:DUF4956 domain-containing protein [Bradyrhizobium guangdongense]TPQ43003.1 hypothetical protein C2U70_00170 [Bradyrhizobium guangdongense]
MDEFLKQIQSGQESLAPGFTFWEFAASVVLAALLSMTISLIYRRTHGGISYSRSFVLTIIIMSVTVSFIMLIIGSNLARAFSLVGALSIVRYRNAIKDSRDISYIFLAMAVGMACGVKLYGMAIVFTLFAGGLLLLLDGISFGAQGRLERLIQFAFSPTEDYVDRIEKDLKALTGGRFALLSSETLGQQKVLVYSAEFPRKRTTHDLLNQFAASYQNLDIKILTGFDRFTI